MTVPQGSEMRLSRDFLVTPATAGVVRLGEGVVSSEPLPCAVSIGVYDGFHVGHASLLRSLVLDARARGLRAVAVTFDPDPDCVVAPFPAKKLMDVRDRLHALATSGVDLVAVVPFTKEVASLDHERFFERVLFPSLDVRAVHVGENFRLGAGGASTVDVIESWGAGRGIDVLGHRLVTDDGRAVSATRIRRLLEQGELARANEELGRPYFVRGVVRSGRGEGAGMGFPTANVEVSAGAQVPADGVYAGYVLVGDEAWPAAVNVGLPPTFALEPGSAHMEANLIGFSGDVYGREVKVMFCERLRASRKFESREDLVSTVLGDIERVRESYGSSARRCCL